MARQMTIEFRNFTGLDLSTAVPYRRPRYKAPGFGEQTMVRGAITGAAAVSNAGKVMADTLAFENAAAGSVRLAGTIPGATIAKPHPDITYAFGGTVSAGAVATVGVSGGVYVWAKFPGIEVGTYAAVAVGAATNVGYSGGGELTIYFGSAPAMLAGDSIAVAVDISLGGPVTLSGQVILSAPPGTTGTPPRLPPGWRPEVIGIAFALTAGWSVLPVSISVMPTRTAIRPLASF
ncbi:hypothetical protein [Zavarzinia compransoris]|uniref:Uncharacterized protein n=1 Tax=Zavarzinia compransoris TaxID=1264899 RepID=A0A317EDW3_9PROT|nr:hypothetical protein [Zavarzinia compransoris]PWR23405.1 hypothetical protein DKG75_02205 [Zavarzinia compransoris]TDP46020.1 hypothetical protein DES42_104101 [Zavarzinia compransoris]